MSLIHFFQLLIENQVFMYVPFINYCQFLFQDVVNKYKMVNKKMNEAVVLYYTINILRILEACHKCGIIHGDVKPDNFLVIEKYVSFI